jgi:hypothetical protein
MGRPKKNDSNKTPGQMDLIDTQPENSKEIIKLARAYQKAKMDRIAALETELDRKGKLLELIHAAKLNPVDGVIKFTCDGFTITVTPRDELIKVKSAEDEANEE